MRIQATDERHYLVEVFTKLGFNQDDSQLLADTLVDADLRGISSHGIQRLAWYRRMIKEGTIIPQNKAKIIRELPGSVLVDANQNMGQLATVLATQKIIEKAKKTGVAIAVIRNSNHFGTAGYYTRLALEAGLVGVALTNTRPLVVPTNATQAFLGSNAFAFGFPASPHPFMFDGATCVVSGGGVLTLGGNDEENSNYKGMGNSIVIELLTGILAQGSISADTVSGKHDFSQFVMVLNPAFFGDPEVLKKDATSMLDRIRQLEHIPGKEIWVPGDREYRLLAENKEKGVTIDEKTYQEMKEIGTELGIDVP